MDERLNSTGVMPHVWLFDRWSSLAAGCFLAAFRGGVFASGPLPAHFWTGSDSERPLIAVNRMTHGAKLLAGTVLSVWLLGCQSYHPLTLDHAATEKALQPPGMDVIRVRVGDFKHPILKPIAFDATDGLSPDEAAILAVLANPALRASRDARQVSAGQLLQARILPNPEVSLSADFPDHSREARPSRRQGLADELGVLAGRLSALSYARNPPAFSLDGSGLSALSSAIQPQIEHGGRAKLFTGNGMGLAWEITSLLTRPLEVRAAMAHAESVDLDIAWMEWQVAQKAKLEVYRLASVRRELAAEQEIEKGLRENADLMKRAADAHEKLVADEIGAAAALNEAHLSVLALEQEAERERLVLNQVLGFPPDARLDPEPDLGSPYEATLPQQQAILEDLESGRLDLLALKKGYESQDAKVRAAVRAQFPKITVGLNHAHDTSHIGSTGAGITFAMPLFDRNQGQIAIAQATRQQLFDEYNSRVFDARAETALILADIQSVKEQIEAARHSLTAVQALADAYEKGSQQGNVDIISYYVARNAAAVRRVDIIKLQETLAELGVGLEVATGRYFPKDAVLQESGGRTGQQGGCL